MTRTRADDGRPYEGHARGARPAIRARQSESQIACFAWRRLDLDAGLGLARLVLRPAGATVSAFEVALMAERRWAVEFWVELDSRWHSPRALVPTTGARSRRVALEGDGAGNWRRDGRPAPDLAGCLDVDISATAVTNLFAIRRLDLAVGQSAVIRAAWIDGEDPVAVTMDQTYTRLPPIAGVAAYEYRDPRFGAFRLTVDPDGVPIDYEGFAERIVPTARRP